MKFNLKLKTSNQDLTKFRIKLSEVDYRERLSLVYQWTKTNRINKSEFIELINVSINLDLLLNED